MSGVKSLCIKNADERLCLKKKEYVKKTDEKTLSERSSYGIVI